MQRADPGVLSPGGAVRTSIARTRKRGRHGNNNKNVSESRVAYAMLLPTVAVLGGVTAVTLSYLLFTSLRGRIRGEDAFVFLRNYGAILQDDAFWASLARSAIYVVCAVGVELALGIAFAVLFHRRTRAAAVCRSLIIVPMMIAPIVAGLIWRILYDPSFGILNLLLSYVGIGGPAWLGNATTALPALIIVDIWQWTPFVFLVILAALSALPTEPAEAALVDGANAWQVFWYVTLPDLVPIIDLIVLLRGLDALKAFDIIFTLTQGGPGRATETAVFNDYLTGFRYFDFGRAAAMAVLLLLLTIVIANVYVRVRHVEIVKVTA
jgi:multiple sugar transport system permease protein